MAWYPQFPHYLGENVGHPGHFQLTAFRRWTAGEFPVSISRAQVYNPIENSCFLKKSWLIILQLRLCFVCRGSHFFIMSESYYLYVKRHKTFLALWPWPWLDRDHLMVTLHDHPSDCSKFWQVNLCVKMHSLQELPFERQLKLKGFEQRSCTNLPIFFFYCRYKRNTGTVKVLLFSRLVCFFKIFGLKMRRRWMSSGFAILRSKKLTLLNLEVPWRIKFLIAQKTPAKILTSL